MLYDNANNGNYSIDTDSISEFKKNEAEAYHSGWVRKKEFYENSLKKVLEERGLTTHEKYEEPCPEPDWDMFASWMKSSKTSGEA